MKILKLVFTVFVLFGISANSQQNFSPNDIIIGTFMNKTMPLRDFAVSADKDNTTIKEIKIVTNNFPQNQPRISDNPFSSLDQNVQDEFGLIQTRPLEQNFVGASLSESHKSPPDPTGAAGPNHYVHAVNEFVKVFSKTGDLLVGPVDLGAFMGVHSNSVDPIVMYDQLADRWFVSRLNSSINSLAVAVSETNDPTGAYNVYEFIFPSIPDYPKYSVWHDAYYLTINSEFNNYTVYALERDVILAGGANPRIVGFPLSGLIHSPSNVLSPKFANITGTTIPTDAPGYVIQLQDDGWVGVSSDHLKVWEINLDWSNTSNSTISAPLEIPTQPFKSDYWSGTSGIVAQPGTDMILTMMGGMISLAANYRSFLEHNSWVISFNTDVDSNGRSGIRWIELRNDDTNDWHLFQEGTYAPNDGHSRFLGSAGMDADGNIGMGFNIASKTLEAGIRYTGRYNGDPLGQMTVVEKEIVPGAGVQTLGARFGDYSHLTMDPDNYTFWFTSQYFSSNDNWRTQIAAFTLSSEFEKDVGVNAILQPENGLLTNEETVKVRIRNFGTLPQMNIPLELRIDGNLIASETYYGTIAVNETVTYTFSQTVDMSIPGQTYIVEVGTNLLDDEFSPNDSSSKEITNLFYNDVGVVEISSPSSGPDLDNEIITATIKNFGANLQSNFNVQYVLDGGTPIVETFVGPIASEQEMHYNFNQTADISELGTYNLTVSTALSGDSNAANNNMSKEIKHILCQPTMNCSLGDGFRLVSIAEIHNPSACEGYADFTHLVANLEPNSINDFTVTTNFGDQFIKVWIDFNDDNEFTSNEIVVNNYVIAPGQGSGVYTETMNLEIPADAAVGLHRMRAKTNWNFPVLPDCWESTFGETEDYSVNIGYLGIDDFSVRNGDLRITSEANKQYEITLTTDYEGIAYIAIYNLLGQQLKTKMLSKTGNSYRVKLDMSEAASGVYIVKVGGQNTKAFQTAKFIVQ